MKLLAFLFALLAVVAMVSASNNPICNNNNEAAQSGPGYQIHAMNVARKATTNANARRHTSKNYRQY